LLLLSFNSILIQPSVMKFLRALPLLALLGFTTVQASAQTSPKATAKTSTSATVKIKTSAVCDMCKTRLEKSMAYESGVQSAVLDVPSQVLTVTYRPDKISEATVRTAVQKTGYDADDATADTRAYNRLPDCCKKTNAVH
jgi:copper chaperone CopZ